MSGRVALSAVLSWTLIPIAVADAPTPVPANSAAAAEQPGAQPGKPSGKRLFTVPEDGMGDDHWLSGATSVVREIMLKRPKEDLVICVAGCVEKQDRVVYAQPADLAIKRKADVVSDAAMPADEADKRAEFVPSSSTPESSEAPAAEAPAGDAPVPTASAEPAAQDAAPAPDAHDDNSSNVLR
jgi:hypothetical protein